MRITMHANMHADSVLHLASVSLDIASAGWIATAALTLAWSASVMIRRRSTRALMARLLEGNQPSRDDQAFPLLEPLASTMLRRQRQLSDAHAQLAERLAELERVLRATPISVISLDHLQRIVSANPAAERLLGFDERTARGRLLQESVRQPGLNQAVSNAFAAGTSTSGELHLDLHTPLEVQISCEPLHTEGQPLGLVISLVDVTRMRRLESMRSEFAANVSHELRTPITNIRGYIETLLNVGITDPAQQRRFLDIIYRNTVRLSGIVEDLLTLAFLEEPEAKHTLTKETVSARDIVKQVIEDLGFAASARSSRIIVAVGPDVIVYCNRALVEQALMNLLANAIKYSKEGASITLRAAREDSMIRFSVEDTGPGIAAKHLLRIFERFYRVDTSRARTQGATGLGLAIVKHIAVIHGGSVNVTSQIGDGCCFSLLIPAAAQPNLASTISLENRSA